MEKENKSLSEERPSPTLHTLSDDIQETIPTYKIKEFIKEDLELIKLIVGQKISYGELLVRRNKLAGKELI